MTETLEKKKKISASFQLSLLFPHLNYAFLLLLILWEVESCTGGIGGTGVMPWRCQPGSSLCREGSKPSGVTYGLKSSDTKRHQGGSCAPIHTYLHVTFSVRQQWLRGASPSSCDNHAILFFSNQPHHSCIQ